MHDSLIDAMEELDDEKVIEAVKTLCDQGCDSIKIMYSLNCGMQLVGKRFEEGDFFLADLIVSGWIYREALSIISSGIKAGIVEAPPVNGKVVIGVPSGDIHDIGKDIVIGILRSEGFEVIDLGINVACEDFVTALQRYKPDVLALSGVMSSTLEEMETIITELDQNNLRSQTAIIIGGVCATKSSAERIGANYYSNDPIETLTICREIVK